MFWCGTEYWCRIDLPSFAWHAAIFLSRSGFCCSLPARSMRMRILTLPFSGCAFSRCHSQDAHSHAAILRMRILTLPFSGCAFSRCHSQDAHSHILAIMSCLRFIYVDAVNIYTVAGKSREFVTCHVLLYVNT